MPLDPSILLNTTNINEQAAKQTAIATQAQAQANQLRMQQYGLAQAKQDFEDQQKFKQAWRAAAGDPTKTIATATAMGVGPKLIQAYQEKQIQLQAALDTHNKTVADTGKTNLDTLLQKNQLEYTQLKPLIDAKNDIEFQSKKPQVMASLKQAGYSDDEVNQLMGATQQQVQDHATGLLGVDALAKVVKSKTEEQNADAATKNADTTAAKFGAEQAGIIADGNQKKLNGAATALSNALRSGGPVAYNKQLQAYANDPLLASSFPPPEKIAAMQPAEAFSTINYAGMTSEQRTQADQAKAALAQKAANDEVLRKQGLQRLAIEAQNLKIRKDEYEAQFGDPANASDGVKQLAQGLINGQFSPAEIRRFKGGQQALQLASTTPGWTDQRYATLKNFKSGKDSDDLKNLVMLDAHLDRFAKNSGKAGYTGLVNPLSSSGNDLKIDTNDVSGIMGRLTKGGMLTAQEHKEYMDRLLSKLPYKREDAAAELKELLAGKIQGMKQKFLNGTGFEMPDSMLSSVAATAPKKVAGPADVKSMSTDDLLKALGN